MIPKEKWAEIIKDFHEKGIPNLVERKLDVPKEIPLKRAISITGPRRAGKTYGMFLIIKRLLADKIPLSQMIYVNFEKTGLEGADSTDLTNMIETVHEIYPENKKMWLFLDEIQNVKGWEKSVRTIIDSENIQVFLSGSSSRLLSKEIATSMRGRTITYNLLPFSFAEYLFVEKINHGGYLSTSERSRLISKLSDYLENGGYPDVILYPDEKEKILSDIVETTIYRDVIERYKIRNIKLLKLLINSLMASAGREFSVHKFYNFIKSMGIKASKNSLYNYIDALGDVFFVFPVRKFSRSYKEVEQTLPKIYLVDNGILSVNGAIGDRGKLIENLVFIELTRRGNQVRYYKSPDGKEVDFVIVKKNKVEALIQVAFSIDDFNTKERELVALLKASKELECDNLTIITWSKKGEETTKGKTIKYIPLWEWLLQIPEGE